MAKYNVIPIKKLLLVKKIEASKKMDEKADAIRGCKNDI